MAWDGRKVTDALRLILRDVTNAVAIAGEYLDGIGIIGVGGVWFQGGYKLTEVVVYVLAIGNACNGEFEIVTYALILWPHADMVAFVFDTEVLEFLDGGIFTVG